MALDPTDWMPTDLDQDVIDTLLAAYPDDPHRAAAEAWEAYAATLTPTAKVQSVSTGAQSVTYTDGTGEFAAAMGRAKWHLSRAKVRSVKSEAPADRRTYGLYGYTTDTVPEGAPLDPEDRGVIQTYEA